MTRFRIGTLCIVVGPCSLPRCVGRTCTIRSERFEGWTPDGQVAHGYLVRYANGELMNVDERCLRPLAPPGDPDRVAAPEREPAELVR